MKIPKSLNCHYLSIFVLALSTLIYAEDSEAPSMELLEFLAEFEDVDDESFEAILFHALEDGEKSETNSEVNDDE